MDLTPKSYTNSSSSPRFPTTYRPHSTLTPPSYPTPPQSRAANDTLPTHTPTMSGLGISGFGTPLPVSVTQVPICAPPQPIPQPTISWPQASPASTSYSNPSPDLGVYTTPVLYENYDSLPADMHSPFVMANAHADTANLLAFFSPQLQNRRAGNPSLHQTPVLNNYDSNSQTPTLPRTRPAGRGRFGVVGDSGGSQMPRNTLKRSFARVDDFSYESQPTSLPPVTNPTRVTLGMAGGAEKIGTQRSAQRSPLKSSDANSPVQAKHPQRTPEKSPKSKKQKKANQGALKFHCPICNKRFTRNSNRSAHMRTHDPDRQRPNECTRPDCDMKFSRPTDLHRHIKSVHDNIKDHHCEKCGAPFSRRDTLRRHSGDACRRRQRRAQRTPTTVPASTDAMPEFQQMPSSVEYREPISIPTTTHGQMQPQFFMFHGDNGYAQYPAR